MSHRVSLTIAILAAGLLLGGVALAEPPKPTVFPRLPQKAPAPTIDTKRLRKTPKGLTGKPLIKPSQSPHAPAGGFVTMVGGAKGKPAAKPGGGKGDARDAKAVASGGAGRGAAKAGGQARPQAGASGHGAGANQVHVREGKGGEIRVERDSKCIPWQPGEKREFNYRDKEIYEIVLEVAQNFCQNFIIPPAAKRGGKITILSFEKVDRDEAWRAFLAALHANKMTVVPAGAYLKLLQSTEAKGAALPLVGPGGRVPDEDRVMTRIIPLEHVDAQEIAQVLVKMKSQVGDIVPYPRTNSLIVTDVGAVIRRYLDMLRYLDVPGGQDRIWIYQVQYGEAQELAQVLEQIFEANKAGKRTTTRKPVRRGGSKRGHTTTTTGGGDSGSEVEISKIIADERTNQLIFLSTERAFRKVMEVLQHIDVDVEGEGQVHVYYLKNADAEEIAGVLSSIVGGGASSGKRRKGGKAKRTRATTSSSGGAALFQGEVKITADKATNALVVVASDQDYKSLVNVIQMLDIRRPQVFVEALILEVNISKTRELGLALHGGYLHSVDGEDIPILAGTNMKSGSLNSVLVNPLSLMGLGVALRGPTLEGSGAALGLPSDLPSLGVVLNALQTNDDVNILSTPHILTTDNEEAEIEVGQNVPFIAGGMGGRSMLGGLGSLGRLASSATGATSALGALGGLGGLGGFGFSPYFNVQRQDVSLKLKITPHINESDFVRLELEQTIEELGADNPGLGPTTTKRAAKTTIVAKDQQTVVIGGLMKDNTIEGVEKVPFLGDIPVIGYLFRTSKRTVQKQNLMLLLTPYIIRDPSDFREIFLRKMQEREEFIERYSHVLQKDVHIPVNYEHKHGLLEEIHQVLTKARAEAKARREAMEAAEEETPLFEEVGAKDGERGGGAEAGGEGAEPGGEGVEPGGEGAEPAGGDGSKGSDGPEGEHGAQEGAP